MKNRAAFICVYRKLRCVEEKRKKLDELGGVDNVLADQDLDEVDQSEDAADAADEGHDDLEDTLLVLAHDEVVNTETAEEEADESDHQLVLAAELTLDTDGRGLLDGNAAAEADGCIGSNGITAILAESIAVAGLDAAIQADGLIFVHFFTAIFAKH